MIVFLLCFLLWTTFSSTTVFENATIDISTISSGLVHDDLNVQDTCGSMMVMNHQLYHSSSIGIFQSYLKAALNSYTLMIGSGNFLPFIFGVTQA